MDFVNLGSNVSNDYRFNVLEVEGLPEQLRLRAGDETPGRYVDLQNSGPFSWNIVQATPGGTECTNATNPPTRLSYHLYNANNSSLACEADRGVNSACFAIRRYALCQTGSNAIQPGVELRVPNVRFYIPPQVPPGTYKLRLDLEIFQVEWVSGLSGGSQWPTQDIEVVVEDPNSIPGEQGSVIFTVPPPAVATTAHLDSNNELWMAWKGVSSDITHFDFEYISKNFLDPNAQWSAPDRRFTAQPYVAGGFPVNCQNDLHDYVFYIRGRVGANGSPRKWTTVNTRFKAFPYLDTPNASILKGWLYDVIGPDTVSYGLQIVNAGGGNLQWQVSASPAWLTVSPTSGTNNGIVTVTVTRPGPIGQYTGSLNITTNGSNPVPSAALVACNREAGQPAGSISFPVRVIVGPVTKTYLPVIMKNSN